MLAGILNLVTTIASFVRPAGCGTISMITRSITSLVFPLSFTYLFVVRSATANISMWTPFPSVKLMFLKPLNDSKYIFICNTLWTCKVAKYFVCNFIPHNQYTNSTCHWILKILFTAVRISTILFSYITTLEVHCNQQMKFELCMLHY
jgi:hypothetical protein